MQHGPPAALDLVARAFPHGLPQSQSQPLLHASDHATLVGGPLKQSASAPARQASARQGSDRSLPNARPPVSAGHGAAVMAKPAVELVQPLSARLRDIEKKCVESDCAVFASFCGACALTCPLQI